MIARVESGLGFLAKAATVGQAIYKIGQTVAPWARAGIALL